MVLLNKLSFQSKTSFSKATVVMRFPSKKNIGCPKAPRGFPPRKDGILHPLLVGLSWTSPSPPPESVGRAGGRTLTSQPIFLGSIGYQTCLAMVLRWRANAPAPLLKYISERPKEHTQPSKFELLCFVLNTVHSLRSMICPLDVKTIDTI